MTPETSRQQLEAGTSAQPGALPRHLKKGGVVKGRAGAGVTLRTCGLSLWLNFLFPRLSAYHRIATGPSPLGRASPPQCEAMLRRWACGTGLQCSGAGGLGVARNGGPGPGAGSLSPRPAPWGSLHGKREQSLFAALDFCLVLPPPAPSTTRSLLMFHCPDLHTPRNMGVWGGLRRALPQSFIDGCVHSSWGGNIVSPSDLQDTASPSQKTPFPGDSFH